MTKQSKSKAIAHHICLTLQSAGHEAYWAGGCVRDQHLGIPPKDYDIATSALPEQVEALFSKTLAIGKSFGVIAVIEDQIQTDVATFRAEAPYSDGRHPDAVTFCAAAEDAKRRDFTINALFYDPITERLIDYVDGKVDLEAGLIRAIGNPLERFQEDHLRLLRAVRFSHVLGFKIEPTTLQALKTEAATIHAISVERIERELTRTLTESLQPGDALHTLQQVGLLPVILPEVTRLIGVEQPPDYHPEGDVYTHTRMMLNLIKDVADDAGFTKQELAYATLLHDIAKPDTYALHPDPKTGGKRIRFLEHEVKGAVLADTILKRLKIPNHQRQRIIDVIANHMRPFQATQMRASSLRRMMGAPTFPLLLELHRLDGLGSRGLLPSYTFLHKAYHTYTNEPILPEPWITGRDLIALGMPDGPALGRLLSDAYDRQLEETEPDREALLDWIKKHQK
ncbi:MAG: phosphohydrolase [Kiritimatiellaceae bacterium]|jgi:poly(A) polymerase|nr:phosphohydrolase [Kiritimatiellaceae bacterium]|tara:strand:+ start:790 stop:2148 length:1359 start_codon:yes stop_codon:yes gene_type:complete